MKYAFDVVIVGGGVVGAVAALALAQTTSLTIALIDSQSLNAQWQSSDTHQRVSALSLASKQIFSHLNVWEEMSEKRISSYNQMHVWDEHGEGVLHFNSHDVNQSVLGYIVEDNVMRSTLLDKVKSCAQITCYPNTNLVSLHQYPSSIELVEANGQMFSAKLLIAADGANSWVREQVGFLLKKMDYQQTAIVTNVTTEFSHQHTAWQRFLATGPLAFLPLSDVHQCSIVWSAVPSYAEKLLSFSDEEFSRELSMAFENKLGVIKQVTKRLSFPLQMQHAKQYIAERVALIGDAAHTIHPLAGQGVNLGLLDAVTLAEKISDAVAKKRDFASVSVLRQYERWRKAENVTMLTMVDFLKYIFMQKNVVVKAMRNKGMQWINAMPVLKKFLVNYALGKRADLPRLAKD